MIDRCLARLRDSTLARNTFWMFLGQGLRLVIQAAYFVLIARSLGAQQYGAFIAVTAFTQIVAPFVGLGSANLLVKNVARDRSLLADYWGNGLFMVVSTAVAATSLVIVVGRTLLPSTIALPLIVLVAFADLLFARIVDLATVAFQSVERLARTAQLNVLISFCRLIGIAAIAQFARHPDARLWSQAYLAASAVTAMAAVLCVTHELTRPRLALWRIRPELHEGLYFAGGLSAQTVYNDIDKSMLARLSTLEATGIYAAAYRLIDVAFIPVRSLLWAANTGFFRAGSEGISGALAYMKRLLPRAILYSLLISAALMITAPLVPYVLGSGYAHTTEALRWLALLPLLKTLHDFEADCLTSAGYQGTRMLLQVIVAVFNVVLNLWLIPAYGWRGAAWSSVGSDALLVLMLCLALLLISASSRNTRPVTANLAVAGDWGDTE